MPRPTPANVLDYEIAEEMASALGRMGRGLEKALAALRAFDAAHPVASRDAEQKAKRRELMLDASEALWLFVVQRESAGLRDTRTMLRAFDVPSDVQTWMGPRPRAGGVNPE